MTSRSPQSTLPVFVPRYVVYDPEDPRKGKILPDPTLSQIILAEGETITKALSATTAPPGSVVWDRKQARIAYVVPGSGR